MSHELSVLWQKIASDTAKAVEQKGRAKVIGWDKNGLEFQTNGKVFKIKIEKK